MKLIIGLGNPGKKYFQTRHNLGFMVLDQLIKNIDTVDTKTSFKFKKKFNSKLADLTLENRKKILMAKPQTFINHSGLAVKKITDFYKINPTDIAICYDDLDLPLGSFRIRHSGSAAGHKGVQSIIDSLGTDSFTRFRLGIGPVPNNIEPSNFVLQKFNQAELKEIKKVIAKVVKVINN